MIFLEGFIIAILILETTSYVNNQSHCLSSQLSSCHDALWYNSAMIDNCSIKRIPRSSTACTNLHLRSSNAEHLGQVILRHYLFEYGKDGGVYHTTGLNSTLSNIKWTRLRFQYKDQTNDSYNFCVEVRLRHKSQSISGLPWFYDCLWATGYEDRIFHFRYELYDSLSQSFAGRHYIFQVPRHYMIRSSEYWQVFMYIDITELPILTLHWESLLEKARKFHIEVFVNNKLVKSENSTGGLDKYGQFVYSYDVGSNSGKIHFTVRTLHEECNDKCALYRSPTIDVETVSNQPLLIGIVGSVVLLPVFLYSMYYVWKRCCLLAGVVPDYVPVVLLVYRRSLRSHTHAVIAFAKYLREFCYVNALLDELDIPLTESKDPHEWYQKSFSEADVVIIISSPTNFDPMEAGIYQRVDILALRILSEKFFDPNCKQRFFSLLLPYCCQEDIPVEGRNVRQFSLKKDLNELLWHMRFGGKCYCASKIGYYCSRSQIPGGESDLMRHGKILLDALQTAEDDVKKITHPSRKTVEDNCERVPLQEVIMTENSNSSERTASLMWLKDNTPDIDYVQNIYSEYPGDIQNTDLLGLGNSSTSNEQIEKIDLQIDLNELAL